MVTLELQWIKDKPSSNIGPNHIDLLDNLIDHCYPEVSASSRASLYFPNLECSHELKFELIEPFELSFMS